MATSDSTNHSQPCPPGGEEARNGGAARAGETAKAARLASEEQARHSAALLRAVTEGTSDAVYAKDAQGRYLLANDGTCRILGKSREEVLGKDDTALFSPDEARAVMVGDRRVMQSGATQTYEEVVTIGGEARTFLSTKGPMRDSQGQVSGLFGIARDITQRQRAEAERHRLDRALRAICECNEALIRATDEAALLNKVCRIVTDIGGYGLAWVGYAEQDESKAIRPVAQAGYEEGYLETLKITWADTERGHGPTGTAIRTGQPCTVRDTQTEPRFAPWREEARKRGYKSLLALPLKTDGPVFGALSISCTRTDAFDAEELALLTKLADDLAYGITALRTRAALRQSEERLEFAMEGANDGLWDVDLRTNSVFLSPRGCRMFGYPPAEFHADVSAWNLMVHPDDLPATQAALEEHLSGRAPFFEIEQRLRTKSGEYKWILARGKVSEWDAAGRPARMTGTHTDITARKQFESALQRELDFSAAVLNSLPGVVYCYDERLRFLRWNKNFEWVTGYTGAEIARLSPLDLFAGADKALLAARIREVFDEGASEVEADFVAKDGTRRPYYFTGLAAEIAGRRCLVGVGIDVSVRRRVEAALRDRTQQLQMAVQVALMGVWHWDPQTDTITTIHGGGPISGLPEGMYPKTGEAFRALVHPEDRPLVAERLRAALAMGEPYQAEFRLVLPDHSTHWVSARGQCSRDAAGRPLLMVGVDLDITESKRAEDRVTRSQAQLRALLARMEQLREEERTRMAREVHDVLGQLLTGLKMDMSWWERRFTKIVDESLRRSLEQRVEATSRLADRMIETVQKISRELRPSVLDNIGLGAALQFEARAFQERTGLVCQVSVPAETFALDPDRATGMFRVFQELLTNVARHAQATRIIVALRRTAEHLTLEVMDNGRGIRAEALSDPKSLGLLGMTERASLMGGRLEIHGDPGGGTTATLTIPAKFTQMAWRLG